MNDFADKINYGEKRNKLIGYTKIIVLLILILIVGTIVMRNCSKMFDDKEETDRILQNSELLRYDINKSFIELNITTQIELNEYLHWLVENYLKPKEYVNLIDWDDSTYQLNGMTKWEVCENGMDIINEFIIWQVYEELINRIVNRGYDWSILPLSDKFIKKFNGIDIPTYFGLFEKDEIIDKDLYIGKRVYIYRAYHNEDYFYLSYYTGNGEEQDLVWFKKYMTEDGYLDDVELANIVHMYDSDGYYITKKDDILMDIDYRVEHILYHILANKEFYYQESNIILENYDKDAHENVIIESGLTDRFRNYYESLKGVGILPDKLYPYNYEDNNYEDDDYDKLEIKDVNVEEKCAIAKVTLGKQKKIKYYDIYWTIDEKYRLDSLDLKLTREEQID